MIVKCLSLWEPWATLMMIGAKRIETRSWYTPYRGPLLIHAAKNRSEIELVHEPEFTAALKGQSLHFGQILCVVDLINCERTETLCDDDALFEDRGGWTEWDMGNYGPNRFGWVTENVRPLPQPLDYRGAQGLFNVELDDRLAESLGIGTGALL